MEYLVPIVVGIIASLLAPIVSNIMQARVADKAARNQRRRDLVDSWRQGLASAGDSYEDRDAIRSSGWYESLRPYLDEKTRADIEQGYPPNTGVIRVNVPGPPGERKMVDLRQRRNAIAERVDGLAKEWKVD